MKLLILALAAHCSVTEAVSLQCAAGLVRCVKSQGSEIPSKQTIELMERCDEFTQNNIGLVALRKSQAQINEEYRTKKLTPLVRAWYAFDALHDSPLRFDRTETSASVKYIAIKRACAQLERDFNDESKWTK